MFAFIPEIPKDSSEVFHKLNTICSQLIRPVATQDDREERFRKDIFFELKKNGLTSLLIPAEWGGQNSPQRVYYQVLSELAKASASYSITVGVHHMIQAAVLQFGSEKQKTEFLPGLVTGVNLGAFSLSESGSGSDAASLRTAAQKSGRSYLLNGTKLWCSNGNDADVFLVMARTGGPGPKGISAFLIRKGTPGFSIGKKEKKLGLKHSSLTELVFENCEISDEFRLGQEGEGFLVALSQLDAGRVGIAATALGLAQEVFSIVWKENSQNQRWILSDGMRSVWAELFAKIQSVGSLLLFTYEQKQAGVPITALASQCKLLASDLAMQVSSMALETAGPLGLNPDLGLERIFRDAKALQIVEGTNQIQKLILAREIDKGVQS